MKIKKRDLKYGAAILTVIIITLIVFSRSGSGQYDDFAKCLTEKDTVFYGAFWCPHCADQKEKFGESMRHILYVECSTPDRRGQTQACIDAGIEAYPTWEFPDGTRKTGVLELRELAARSGCAL